MLIDKLSNLDKKILTLGNLFDIKLSITHFDVMTDYGKQSFITDLNHSSLSQYVTKMRNNFPDSQPEMEIQTEFDLINETTHSEINITDIIEKYRDPLCIFLNNLRYVLIFNDILFNETYKLRVKQLSDIKEIPLKYVLDKHVDALYSLLLF